MTFRTGFQTQGGVNPEYKGQMSMAPKNYSCLVPNNNEMLYLSSEYLVNIPFKIVVISRYPLSKGRTLN